MRCPFCSAAEDRVVDTRPNDNEQVIRRRRECGTCQRRFTTYERIELEMPLIVKKEGRRESYDRSKIVSGFKKACDKRAVSAEVIEQEVDKIERLLQEQGDREVPSTFIGDAVMGALRRLDDVAYLRFASVYLSPRDVEELLAQVQRLASAHTGERERAAQAASAPVSSDEPPA